MRDAEAEHEQELHSLRQKNALQRGGDEKRAARDARSQVRSEVEAELAQARSRRGTHSRGAAGARRPARRDALRAATEKLGAERDAALAASNAGSEGIATAVETALREERLKHNEEINALQQDHAVEFAKANGPTATPSTPSRASTARRSKLSSRTR